MERQRPQEIPVKEMYGQMMDYWYRIGDLFMVGTRPIPPRLATFRVDDQAYRFEDVRKTIEIHPPTSNPIIKLLINFNLKQRLSHYHKALGWYDPTINTIGIDKDDEIPTYYQQLVLAEETTHSLIKPKDNLVLQPLEVIRNISYPNLAADERAYKLIKNNTGIDDFITDTSEFFPPLAFNYLFDFEGKDYSHIHIFETGLKDMRLNEGNGLINPEKLNQLGNTILHFLPQYAAFRMLEIYQGDPVRLLDENPDITKISGQELWGKYCLPLLTAKDVK